jgi:hypothetical protein
MVTVIAGPAAGVRTTVAPYVSGGKPLVFAWKLTVAPDPRLTCEADAEVDNHPPDPEE